MMPVRNDQLLKAGSKLSAAAEYLTLAGEDLTLVDRRLEAAANSLALAADNLLGNVLREVTLAALEWTDGEDAVEGEVLP